MKKLLCVLLIISMLFCVLFSGCDSKSNESKIELTLDNYEQYLTVSSKCYGELGEWNSIDDHFTYQYVVSEAEVAATSPLLKFYDCKIEIEVFGMYQYDPDWLHHYVEYTDHTITISLSIGGSGSDTESTRDSKWEEDGIHSIVCMGHRVKSITGYVVVE